MYKQFWVENLKKRDKLRVLHRDHRAVLKWILKILGGEDVDQIHVAYGRDSLN